MRVGNWKTILDPYEWLPPHGESAVSVVIAGAEAKLIVEYDVTVDDGTGQRALRRREIVFRDAFYFHQASFPGAALLDITYEGEKFDDGLLIEFTTSELAEAIQRVSQDMSGISRERPRHFRIAFVSENISFHVFASDVSVSAEMPV